MFALHRQPWAGICRLRSFRRLLSYVTATGAGIAAETTAHRNKILDRLKDRHREDSNGDNRRK